MKILKLRLMNNLEVREYMRKLNEGKKCKDFVM